MSGPVVVIGDVMHDVLVRPLGPLRRGTDQDAEIATAPGGSGANQAAWLAALGVPVRLAARVGAGDSAALAHALAAAGVEPWLASDPDRATGTLVCLIEPDGERSFLTSRGANAALSRADLPDALLAAAAQLHVSGYALLSPTSRAGVVGLMARARAQGVPVSVDPGSAGYLDDLGPAVFLEAVAGADLIFPNIDEARLLTGEVTPERQHEALLRLFPTSVLKQGAAGASAATRGDTLVHAPAHSARVLDTTGAGDAFFAGFCAARLRGEELAPALAAGNRAASECVARLGARPA